MSVAELIEALRAMPAHSPVVASGQGAPIDGVRWQGNHVELECDIWSDDDPDTDATPV